MELLVLSGIGVVARLHHERQLFQLNGQIDSHDANVGRVRINTGAKFSKPFTPR